MRKALPILVFFCTLSALNAQLGFSGSYTWFAASDWEEMVAANIDDYQDAHFFQNGYQVGVDYWFRLKDVRIEFLPEGRYASYDASPVSVWDGGEMQWQSLSFHLNTNIYPLNFFGDCDCPTFSKQDPLFEKGFFLQLSPGIHYLIQSYRSDFKLELNKEATDLAYSIGLGAGLDIGLSDWITITPYGRLTRVFDGAWEGFDTLGFLWEGTLANPLRQPYTLWVPEAGLHLGIRWKH